MKLWTQKKGEGTIFFNGAQNDPRKVNERKESIEVPEYHNSGSSKPIMCNVISGCKLNSPNLGETSYLTMKKWVAKASRCWNNDKRVGTEYEERA